MNLDTRKIAEFWNASKEYVCWGAGRDGGEFFDVFKNTLSITTYIDTDEKKQGTRFNGLPVISFADFLDMKIRPLIIVTCGAYIKVKELLTQEGFSEYEDFIHGHVFRELFFFYYKNLLFMRECNICITSYCSLQCSSCNMRIPEFKERRHFSLVDIKKETDDYFRWVDKVQYYMVLGGEAFLHPNLYEIMEHIAVNYRHKIERFGIATNATVLPSERFLELCKKHNIHLQISDYTHTLPQLKARKDKFIQMAQHWGVKLSVPHYVGEGWLDYGFKGDLGETKERLRYKFKNCNNPWRCVYKGRFYFCHLEVSAMRADLHKDITEDSFDLTNYSDKTREDLLKYDLRASYPDYLSYCKVCKGCSAVNSDFVDSAVQVQV